MTKGKQLKKSAIRHRAKKKAAPKPAKAFLQAYDGDIILPYMKNYRMACCDCGLVHRLNFRVVNLNYKLRVEFQVFRDDPTTKSLRRKGKYPCKPR